jgi:agmatinase
MALTEAPMYTRELLPSFAGVNTFARAPAGTLATVRAGDVVVAGLPHDGTSSSRPGARQGPRAIREASVDFTYDLYASSARALVHVPTGRTLRLPDGLRLVDLGDLPPWPGDLARMRAVARETAARLVRAGALPLVLGGDHYVTYPLAQGVADAAGRRIGLIQLSSQLDLVDRDPVWGPEWHGATVRRLVESGTVDPHRVVFVGTQGYVTHQEWEYVRTAGMTVLAADRVRAEGARRTAEHALGAAAAGGTPVYLSLDIDVVDAGYAAGTGDLVVGGLTPAELLGLVRELSGGAGLAALDVVEVAPGLDPRGRSERLAAEAAIELIAPRVFEAR